MAARGRGVSQPHPTPTPTQTIPPPKKLIATPPSTHHAPRPDADLYPFLRATSRLHPQLHALRPGFSLATHHHSYPTGPALHRHDPPNSIGLRPISPGPPP